MDTITLTENNFDGTITTNVVGTVELGEVILINGAVGSITAEKIRVVNSLPLNPDEGDVCFDASDNGFYIGVE